MAKTAKSAILRKSEPKSRAKAGRAAARAKPHSHSHDHDHSGAHSHGHPTKLGHKIHMKNGVACAKLGVNEVIVQKILGKADKPLSAYDIIPLMSKQEGHPIAPATVYRALQHLTEHGLVSRIESRNAYILCKHPDEDHDCVFFICRQCGTATEAPDDGIGKSLRREASHIGFGVNKQILEVIGLCKNCAAA